MNDLEERVARGVEWLDANGPADWPFRVNLLDFDMSECHVCVLGWTFADKVTPGRENLDDGFGWVVHEDGENPLRLGRDWAVEHGFDMSPACACEWGGACGTEYEPLQELWEQVITDRRIEAFEKLVQLVTV